MVGYFGDGSGNYSIIQIHKEDRRHRETVMMASLGPEGYSGSSDTAASWIGVGSMTFSDRCRSLLPAVCIEDELSVDSLSPG